MVQDRVIVTMADR